ncbi:MAG TPA: threonine/serine dehydratase [Pyrinomonadaceae bacterium]|nr:threonine/serine dehydratase [Pyrinomonadaceae bacterium]
MLTLEFIREAHARIAQRVHRTPVMSSRAFNSAASGREVFFKCENFQRAGAFKMRGATNKILSLSDEERARGVAAFSSGNHAQAVALAARDAGTRAVIVMPEDAPRAKVAATRGYGAEVVFYDRQRDDREAVARDVAERNGLVLVPPYDDYYVMAGQGTCAIELMEEVGDLDAIVVPCGGGGLFAGASTAARGLNATVRCFAVEPATGDETRRSFIAGERITIPPPPTIADGARVQTPGALTFPFVQRNAEDVLTVSDAETTEAMKFLLFRLKILVEPTGALAAAAVLFDKLPHDIRRVGIVLTGGNVDADMLARLVSSNSDGDGGSDNDAEQMLK